MFRLDGVARHYDWGSPDAIPTLLGREADGRPWAELWFGAHPSAPSTVHLPDGTTIGLDELIAADPVAMVGPACRERFGPALPYLVKLLAAAQPLSLQVHPTREQAAEGFAAEDRDGIALGDPRRTYVDRNHKPELVVALSTFTALSGFRPPGESAELLARLGVGEPWVSRLRAGALDTVLWELWELDVEDQAALVGRAAAAAANAANAGLAEAAMVGELCRLHPGDIGAVVALLLRRIELAPGSALYAPAGRLHAYLGGLGVEVMASSDNVVRGGLTSKAVNLRELRRILDVRPEPVEPMLAGAAGSFDTPADDFRVQRIPAGDSGRFVVGERGGAEVVLCVGGTCEVVGPSATLRLAAGGAAFVPHAEGPYRIRVEGAAAYRVTVGSFG